MQSKFIKSTLRTLLVTVTASIALLMSSCDSVMISDPSADGMADGTAIDTIATLISVDPEFSTLYTALQTANLTDTLTEAGPFTVFAPNNAAFEALGADFLDDLLADPDELRNVVLYHVIQGQSIDAVLAISTAETQLTTAIGEPVNISLNRDVLMINTARVVRADILATNGVIHEIDEVLQR